MAAKPDKAARGGKRAKPEPQPDKWHDHYARSGHVGRFLVEGVSQPATRFLPRRPAIFPMADCDDIVAELHGALSFYRLSNGTKFEKIETLADDQVKSSPTILPRTDGTAGYLLAYVWGPQRSLRLTYYLYDRGKREWLANITVVQGVIGEPAFMAGQSKDFCAQVAVRTDEGIRAFGIFNIARSAFDLTRSALQADESFGALSGFADPAPHVVVPTVPPQILYAADAAGSVWSSRGLPGGFPDGDMCATWTLANNARTYHLLVPSGNETLYYQGLTEFSIERIDGRLDGMAIASAPGNRLIVLGRIGQQLRSFWIDYSSGKGKLGPLSSPFGLAITGNPLLFRGYAPNGERHLAALVYAEADQLMYLWYDAARDRWSLLPP